MNYEKLIIGNHLWFGRRTEDNFVIQTGTVSVTEGAATLAGVGTTFTGLTGAALAIGSRVVTIASVASPTAATMTNAWYGSSATGLPFWKRVANSINYDTPPADNAWISLGDIEDANFTTRREQEEVYSPRPGFYRQTERITKTYGLTIEFTLQDMSELFYEMLMSSRGPIGSGSSGGPYQPYSAVGEIRGWFKCTQFGHEDTQINIFTCWGVATAQATRFANEMTKGKVAFDLLDNPHNTGVISLEA